jgi:hypothetical protein
MENLLPLILVLACPLGMLAIGAIGWIWAKASRRSEAAGAEQPANPSVEAQGAR